MERKLTTILAADVVGYSKMMAANEESTLGLLRERRSLIDGIIDEYGGVWWLPVKLRKKIKSWGHGDKFRPKKLNAITGLKIHGEAEHQAGIISFTVNNIHPYDIGVILNNFGIAVRTGHHCAQPLMKRFETESTARVSFGIYNNQNDVDCFIRAIDETKKLLK